MKILKLFSALVLSTGLMIGANSCVIHKKDNGNHKGWYKNPNNPHHPNTTNPGHTTPPGKAKAKAKPKAKSPK